MACRFSTGFTNATLADIRPIHDDVIEPMATRRAAMGHPFFNGLLSRWL